MNQLANQKIALSNAYANAIGLIQSDKPKEQILFSVQLLKQEGEKAIDNQAPFSNDKFRFGDFAEAFEDSSIQKLIWIPGSLTSGVLTEYLSDMEVNDWKEIFPRVVARDDFKDIYYSRFDEDRLEALTQANYLGFIAEIHVPIKLNIVCGEDGELKAWSSGAGHRLYKVYSESIIDLVDLVKVVNANSSKEDLENQNLKEVQNG